MAHALKSAVYFQCKVGNYIYIFKFYCSEKLPWNYDVLTVTYIINCVVTLLKHYLNLFSV